MKQGLSNTKKSLGRVWFRYFQLYGLTHKLAMACVNIGWTRADVDNYTRGHYHLVNQQMANMVKNNEPDVPNPGALEWLQATPQLQDLGRHQGHKCMQVKRRANLKDIDQEQWH